MKSLTVIILYSEREQILEESIQSIWKLNPLQIIIFVPNDRSNLYEIAKKHKCHIVFMDKYSKHYDGYGACIKAAKGEVLLFLDGNFSLSTNEMQRFIEPIVTNQADVVLNKIDKLIEIGKCPNMDIVWRKMLNEILSRPDLKSNSILSLPYALTKEVVENIGFNYMEDIVLSHMKIVNQGWRINDQYAINTLSKDETIEEGGYLIKKELSKNEKEKVERYLRGIAKWIEKKGRRVGFTDAGKRRDIVQKLGECKRYPSYHQGWGMHSSIYDGKQLSVIIPVQNEEETIEQVILEARKIEPLEIIVVVNGSTDQTANIAKRLGVTIIEYNERLGHNVGRAIGALEATGDILLFIDGDFSVSGSNLHHFTKAVSAGVDIALNDLNPMLHPPFYVVDVVKYMLNLACNRPELSNGSLVAIPHAMSRSCLDAIGWETLLCPSLAQVKAILQGYRVECVHYVDVVKPNRIRLKENVSHNGHPPAVLRIIGDHVEALSYLIEQLEMDGKGD
ncbi:glycosyltransferase [Bacillus cereus]|uniref:glycosyltransferase family 2 protein n=1 Tax=Bacillus thuringiensis TaxID=1428 RepID=UPI000CD86AF7|nr:glycosyltransferase [Bacillus thuringiensis]MDA2299927.1 glycosyltransferase [Bacillus cereus]MDA2305367.1 glycosyltransferase [Bacillus cereus]QFQ26763.1 glycosyltransferase [Bacillus thuringiensis]